MLTGEKVGVKCRWEMVCRSSRQDMKSLYC